MLTAPGTLNYPSPVPEGSDSGSLIPAVAGPAPAGPDVGGGYHRWWSRSLRRDCELQVHGRSGPFLIAFPPAGGRFFDFDHNGLVAAAASELRDGQFRLVCLDHPDAGGWTDASLPLTRRVAHADALDSLVIGEVVPWLEAEFGPGEGFGAIGCSLGALAAANLVFRHPDVFQTGIFLSGLYDLEAVLGGFDPVAYFHSPLHYLPNLTDPWFVDRIRTARMVFSAGQGPGEERAADHARRIGEVLGGLGARVWVDHWGHDVTHDWHWWARMLGYFPAALRARF